MIDYRHGGDIYSKEIKYDFSANINPLGMPKAAADALLSSISSFEVYPDTNCTKLVKAISDYENIPERYILCGNGASDFIYRIAYAVQPKKALVTAPTFSEYEHALLNVGCEIEYEMLYEENGFELTERVLEKIKDVDIFFLCNPNNPVGNTVCPKLLEMIVCQCSKTGTLLVVDECFMDFVNNREILSAKRYSESGIIILKAFTKFFALAGLRLGYILCDRIEMIEKLRRAAPCWNVSSAAQIAGTSALSEKGYIFKTIEYVMTERKYLSSELERLGFKVYPSKANFILFKVNFNLEKELLNYKIAIRSCENYIGLGNEFFRIAVRTHDENVKLINTIERILHNG